MTESIPFWITVHSAITLLLTSVVNNKLLKNWEQVVLWISSRQWISWLCAALVGFIASHFSWGVIGDGSWYVIIAKSLISGLAANGLYKITAITKLLEFLKLKPLS